MFHNNVLMFIIVITIAGISYIFYSADYFTLCSHIQINGYHFDNFYNDLQRKKIIELCNNVFKLKR